MDLVLEGSMDAMVHFGDTPRGYTIPLLLASIQCPSCSMYKKDRWLSEKETIDRGMFALNAGFTYNSNVVSVRINYT